MTILFSIQMIAEISDKMPGIPIMWLWSFCVAIMCIGFWRGSPWLYLAAIPIAGWLAFAGYGEIVTDTYFRDAIGRELGHDYLRQAVCACSIPLVALLACGIYDLSRRRNR